MKNLAALVLVSFFSHATLAEDPSRPKGSFYFEGSPVPPYLSRTGPSQRLESVSSTASWTYLNNRPVKVARNDVTTYARGVRLEGLDLGRVDRSINSTDEAAVGAEVRRYLGTVESLIGDTSALVLGNFHVSAMHGGGRDARTFMVRFEQIAHGASLGRGTMVVDGETVILLDVFFGDPEQPNLQREFWASLATVKSRAEESFRRQLGEDFIDQDWLKGPKLFLRITDDEDSVMPQFQFYYKGYASQVNALTLQTMVWSTVIH